MRLTGLAIVLAIYVCFCASISYASDNKNQTVQALTQAYQKDGWDGLSFRYTNKSGSTVIIEQKGVTQESPLTEGQITNVLGTILKPATVNKLKKAGFTNGQFVDGKQRKYKFIVSTKYYKEMQGVFKKMSRGR